MTASLLDGKARAARLRTDLQRATSELVAEGYRPPGLAVMLVGEHPASELYVRNKGKAADEAGFHSRQITLPEETSEETILAHLDDLNADDGVDGILVQTPLPQHLSTRAVLERVTPEKDVDGLGFVQQGRLAAGEPGHVPCTPQGCMTLITEALGDISGARALVLGRSILVGRPMGLLLLAANATVTIAHSRTRDLAERVREADILVAAVGRAGLVQGDWVKTGACVIDVGINRVPAPEKGEGKSRLVGDVAFEAAAERADFITPVPGGVGPMTIASLLANTYRSACLRQSVQGGPNL